MEHNHEDLMRDVEENLRDLFEGSKQSIYLFLDDRHKICNKNFSTLLGYNSPEEWSKVNKSFTEAFVDENSQGLLVSNYANAMENLVGNKGEIVWKRKDGKKVKTSVILVPYIYKNHLFALHFIE